MKTRYEILASGFGGQGVVRLGQILGEAAVKQGYRVTMLKSHGTEMRGGYVRSQLVISKEPIDSPMVAFPDLFVALSLAAYRAFKHLVTEGRILYDPAFVVEIDQSLGYIQTPVPAKDVSVENFGKPVFCQYDHAGGDRRCDEDARSRNHPPEHPPHHTQIPSGQ